MKYKVYNRYTGEIQFTADIDATEGTPRGWKSRLAILWAIKNGANMIYADMRGADMSGANMRGANMRGANMSHANMSDANMIHADMRGADMSGANMRGANMSHANMIYADMSGANMRGANMRGANMSHADMSDADMSGANMIHADMSGANILCMGNMREIRTMQIGKWAIGYTATDMQIGCQRHSIDKWRKWNTGAGRKWVAQMDPAAMEWADRNLALVLQIIDVNPATPTGHK
jgi:hypothetical protein